MSGTIESTAARRSVRVLPRELAEKIAAGEVIERPTSVVKELVENAIDAGATQITVELEDGGKKRITIRDNGSGIADAEVLVALERHATSKITELDDLWNLSTMGFRGEALPSIAAISRFTLRTRAAGEPNIGRLVYLEGGRVLNDEALHGMELGTTITVEDLFWNVPARLKFLRAKSGESAAIRELIEHLALVNPAIGFSLSSEKRRSLQLAPAKNYPERVAAVFDVKPDDIEAFEAQFDDIRVSGFLDRNARMPNSRSVYLSVNGRVVRDKLLLQAVVTALRPRMMEGEYPRLFVAVDVPRTDVDVNVHPTKTEVRFRRSRDVFQVLHGALSKLAITPAKPFYDAALPSIERAMPAARPEIREQTPLFAREQVTFKLKQDAPIDPPSVRGESGPDPKPASFSLGIEPNTGLFAGLHYIGQLQNTYLLFQDADGLVLLDQHAAHERINYEKIRTRFLAEGLSPQTLLVGITLKCKTEDLAIAEEHASAFAKLGFEVEVFGEESLLLRAIPVGLDAARARELFLSLLSELKDVEAAEVLTADPSRLSPKLERLIATMACHASVRAGQTLAPIEARALTAAMEETASSLNCPHGRPASIRLSRAQIEALFKR